MAAGDSGGGAADGDPGDGVPLLSPEEAAARLPDEVKEALESAFKGAFAGMRRRDRRDQLF